MNELQGTAFSLRSWQSHSCSKHSALLCSPNFVITFTTVRQWPSLKPMFSSRSTHLNVKHNFNIIIKFVNTSLKCFDENGVCLIFSYMLNVSLISRIGSTIGKNRKFLIKQQFVANTQFMKLRFPH
jgi:hypothetical protein